MPSKKKSKASRAPSDAVQDVFKADAAEQKVKELIAIFPKRDPTELRMVLAHYDYDTQLAADAVMNGKIPEVDDWSTSSAVSKTTKDKKKKQGEELIGSTAEPDQSPTPPSASPSATPSAPEPAQAEAPQPEVKATEANRRNEVIKLAPMMASMPAGAKPAAAPKKLNPAQVQAAERQRLENQGAQVSSSGMRKMDLTELMQQANIGGLGAGPAAVGAAPSPASTQAAAPAPAPMFPAMSAMQPPPSTVPAPAPAMNELFPNREDDEEDELQRQLDMHPAGKALRATMMTMSDTEAAMTHKWNEAKIQAQRVFYEVSQALGEYQAKVSREIEAAMYREAQLLAKRKSALNDLKASLRDRIATGIPPDRMQQLEQFKEAAQKDLAVWQGPRLFTKHKELVKEIGDMVTIYNTAGGSKPPTDKPAAAPLPQAAPKKEIRFDMPTLKQPKPGADELPPPSARGRGRGRGGGGGGEGRANGQGGRGGAGKASAGAGKPQQQQQSSTKAGGAPPQKPSTNGQLADKPAANGPTNGSAGDSEGDAKKKRSRNKKPKNSSDSSAGGDKPAAVTAGGQPAAGGQAKANGGAAGSGAPPPEALPQRQRRERAKAST